MCFFPGAGASAMAAGVFRDVYRCRKDSALPQFPRQCRAITAETSAVLHLSQRSAASPHSHIDQRRNLGCASVSARLHRRAAQPFGLTG